MPKKYTDQEREEWTQFLEQAGGAIFPKLMRSVGLVVDGQAAPNIELCIQIGGAILLGKPLVLVKRPGQWLPPRLCAVADAVIDWDGNEESRAELERKVQEAMIAAIGARSEGTKQ